VLSEEALVLAALSGACMLLALGVLELVWPSRPRYPVRRRQPQPSPPSRLVESPVPVRLTFSVLPPRPPGETVFKPPAGYVSPPPPTDTVAAPVSPAFVTPAREAPPIAAATPVPEVPRVPEAPRVPEVTPIPDVPRISQVTPIPDAPRVPEVAPVAEVPPARPPEFPEVPPERREIQPATAAMRAVEAPEPSVPIPPRRRSKISPHARPHRVLRGQNATADLGRAPATDNVPAVSDVTPPASDRPVAVEPARSWSEAPTAPAPESKTRRDSPLVERCFALYQEKKFDEVVSIGTEMLSKLGLQWPANTSRDTAALWSVVGLAKQAQGDDDGARLALESAFDAAPDVERPTYGRHLAALSLDAALARLAGAGSQDTADRVATVRAAIAWTDRGLAVAASDTALASARETAYEALWQAYEQAATALLQRQEFSGARQTLHEALADPAIPTVRAAGFRGLLSSTFGAEVGQLTAQAILSMQESRETDALESLKRAEEVLATIPAESLPPARRDEVDQRLWWGYAELGSRRLEAGAYEEALDPLIHALRFDSIGAERQAETRAAIVRTLEGITALRAMSIRRLADAGCRAEAASAGEQLRALLETCVGLGITESDLWAAYTRIQRLCEELGLDEGLSAV
jgi:tetratricopeptide (TPR) repeat protein